MKHQKGFTLLEILFSLVLLSVAAMLVDHGQRKFNINHKLENHFLALQIARSELEEMRSGQVGLSYGTTHSLSLRGSQMLQQLPRGRAVIQVKPFQQAALKQVGVTIFWLSDPGQPHQEKQVQLETLLP